ncbi:MAG: DUF1343 domain-containing protein [Acidobacteria bacterium]|nr:DUF1343 domain-containing protein [Acidobacteriota bacterium]
MFPSQPAATLLAAGLAVTAAVGLGPATRAAQAPTPAIVSEPRLPGIDRVVEAAIAAGQTPGAVALVGRGDRIVHLQAYGARALVPAREAMTVDTVFDLASLTKVVATTTAVMSLVEQGRIRLNDAVAAHVPGFERYGKGRITVGHLLTHVSGLRPDVDLADPWDGYDTAIELASNEVPVAPPGERFIYSDINFFLLGEIVRTVSGQQLDDYTREAIFQPLGMRDTGFLPPQALLPRIAPTERCEMMDAWPCKRPGAAPLRGVVHDPTARRMGGVAGHAGLFGTARDLARFARMLLGGGTLEGTRVLSPATVARMTSRATPPGMAANRGLGWDIDTTYSSNRGELFPVGSFGHTGFTGTSLWIDPASQGYVVFMSSRLHPDGTGDVTPLRARVATIAAAALVDAATVTAGRAAATPPTLSSASVPPPAPGSPVLAGIDVLARDGFALLKGKRVGLLTNHTGRDRTGRSTIDVLHDAPGVTLAALFSPEHGIRGTQDEENLPSEKDARTGLMIYSLYGETRRPTEAMLRGLDAVVIDLADVGTRFYTYHATMGYVMEEAAKRKVEVVVLDRPNPINGWQIEGPLPERTGTALVDYHAMPIRHGLTMGELARLFNGERGIGADLTVVPAEHWVRDAWFDQTGQTWVNPSPNMRNLNQAILYPGIGSIEYSNISVGRGTDQPFEQLGAPWIDGPRLAAELNGRRLPGIRFYPVAFTPASSQYAGEACQGVFLVVTDRAALQPVRVGLEVAGALARLFGSKYELGNTALLVGSRESLERVVRGEDPAVVAESWNADEARWRQVRARYLLYR